MRSHLEILAHIQSFKPNVEEDEPQRWPDLLALLEELTTNSGTASDANAEVIRILKQAPFLSVPIEDIARLATFDLNDDVMRAVFPLIKHSRGGCHQALTYWGAYSAICSRHPNLIEELIKLPMDRLVYYWYAGSVEAVQEVLRSDEGIFKYSPLNQPCFESAAKWVRDDFCNRESLIAKEVQRLWDEYNS
jgi:hypothetical protein